MAVWILPPELAPTAGALEGLGVGEAAGATDGFGPPAGGGVGEGEEDGDGDGLGLGVGLG